MGHRLDRGDVIDMLEESAMRKIPVVVHLHDGRVFEDRVTQIGKYEDQDWVAFAQHDFTPLKSITSCQRAQPPEYSYGGKQPLSTER
jgi:hypothetical protein